MRHMRIRFGNVEEWTGREGNGLMINFWRYSMIFVLSLEAISKNQRDNLLAPPRTLENQEGTRKIWTELLSFDKTHKLRSLKIVYIFCLRTSARKSEIPTNILQFFDYRN